MKNCLFALFLGFASLGCLAQNAADYLLGPGDVVKISVYDNADLSTEAMLTRQGDLHFALLGSVHLAGLSIGDAEAKLSDLLKRGHYIVDPQVTLVVSQYRSQRVSALGEFNRPGIIQIDQPTDLFSLIAQAGGIASSGGDTLVLIHGGKRFEYSISRLMAEQEPSRRTIMVSGDDVLYSPRSMIFVNGEVNRPGSYRLESNMTVEQAIAAAGGFTAKASRHGFVINRTASDGSRLHIDADNDAVLQQGDVVVVAESWF